MAPCPTCNGTGRVLDGPCPLCEGKALKEERDEVEVKSNSSGVAGSTAPGTPVEIFSGGRLTVSHDGRELTYIELRPPPVAPASHLELGCNLADIVVVLDCSYSMEGPRIQRANLALAAIFAAPGVRSLTVIRFGTHTQEPVTFCRGEHQELPCFKADCGATNFTPALQTLEAHLRGRKGEKVPGEQMAVLISDGAASDRPMPQVERLGTSLRELDCPLLSIAITTAVSPDVMVSLSQLHGDLPFLLVQDSDPEEALADRVLETLPLGTGVERLCTRFLRARTGEIVESCTQRLRRDGTTLTLVAPASVPFRELVIAASVVEGDVSRPVELRIEDLDGADASAASAADESLTRLEAHGRVLLRVAHSVIGSFITGRTPREKAEESVLALRATFLKQASKGDLSERDTVMHLIGSSCLGEAEEGVTLTPEQRAEVASLRRARRAVIMEVQQEFNKSLTTVGRNDLKMALEAYSSQSVSIKFNRRVNEIAQQNQQKPTQVVSHNLALRTMQSFDGGPEGDCSRPMAACLLWLCNPYEAVSDFAMLDQGEWVGRAVWVVPGRSAALNCWRLLEILVRPLSITNSLIPQIQINDVDGRRTAQVGNTGYPVFNGCLPMIAPGEHVGAVRLSLEMMRGSTAGQRSLSDLLCGSPDLYAPPMVNAAYVTAVLSSLCKASLESDLDGAMCALLTTLDLTNYMHWGGAAHWEDLLSKLVGEGAVAFIANKDMAALPDPVRAFQPVICTDAAYALAEEQIDLLFCRLFLRSVIDQTSEQVSVFQALGVDRQKYSAHCDELLAAMTDGEVQSTSVAGSSESEPPAPEAIPPPHGFHVHTSRLSIMHGLHTALRRYLKGANLGASQLLGSVMGGAVAAADVLSVLREAGESRGVVSSVFGSASTAPREMLSHMVVVACYGHHAGDGPQPKHDGKYALAVLEAMDRAGWTRAGLVEVEERIRKSMCGALYRQAAERALCKRRKVEIIRAWAADAERFLDEHPWEAHRHEMPRLTLGFTTDRREFGSRAELWAALEIGWYHRADLHKLRDAEAMELSDLDFGAWKAAHRHFLPGFHLYSRKNLVCSPDRDSFVVSMRRDLEKHYSGGNGQMYARNFTQKMQDWVEPYARHIWQEKQIFDAAHRFAREAAAAGSSPPASESVADRVLQELPELSQLDLGAQEARRRHITVLAREACEASSVGGNGAGVA